MSAYDDDARAAAINARLDREFDDAVARDDERDAQRFRRAVTDSVKKPGVSGQVRLSEAVR